MCFHKRIDSKPINQCSYPSEQVIQSEAMLPFMFFLGIVIVACCSLLAMKEIAGEHADSLLSLLSDGSVSCSFSAISYFISYFFSGVLCCEGLHE